MRVMVSGRSSCRRLRVSKACELGCFGFDRAARPHRSLPLGPARRCGSSPMRDAAKIRKSQPRAARAWRAVAVATKRALSTCCCASHTAHAAVGPLEPPQLRLPQRTACPRRWRQAAERRALAHVGRHDRVALDACANLRRHRLLPRVLHPERLLEHPLQLLVDWVSFCRWWRPRLWSGSCLRPAATLTGTSYAGVRGGTWGWIRTALCSGAARCSA